MSQSLTISGIQADLHWEDKAANFKMLEEKINSIKQKTELIILPEMFSTGFSMKPEQLAEDMNGEAIKWMKRISAEKKAIITGSLIIKDGEYFNRLIWMLPNGQFGVYDKRHLFAYADEEKHYRQGNKRLVTSVNGWKVLPLICYDLRFPVWSRQRPVNGSPEYDLLIYVANWPERRVNAWKTLLQARAIENQCYVAGINRVGNDGNDIHYSGESLVVDPMGEILYQKAEAEDVFTVTLQRDHLEAVRKKLPFWKDADAFEINS
jgi:predicted amidohydrolase